jgi:lycopene cyclase domain-containing protein
MKEYTILAFGFAAAVTLLDHLLGTKVTHRRSFWIAQAIMLIFEIPTNGYLTWRPIVLYNPEMFLNIRLGTIPVEDFVYGYGLITLTLIFWEVFAVKRSRTGTDPSS